MKTIPVLFCLAVSCQAQTFRDPGFVGVLGSRRSSAVDYIQKVLSTESANLIGYWPLNETTGSTADDKSTQANDGAYVACTLNETGFGNGYPSVKLDGSTSYLNVYSSAFNTDFNGQEGTAMVWAKVDGAWVAGTTCQIILFRVNDNNRMGVQKNDSGFNCFNISGGTAVQNAININYSSADWFHVCITWSLSANQFGLFINGDPMFTAEYLTGLGTWTGNLSSTSGALFGASATTPTFPFKGWLASAAVWNKALTRTQIQSLLTPSSTITAITALDPNSSTGTKYARNDFSDTSTLWQDAGKTTPVASDGDPIRVAENMWAGESDLTAASDGVRPLYKTGILNSLGCGLWDNSDDQLDHDTLPAGAFTMFWIAKNTVAATGSPIEGTPPGSGPYLVITGTAYGDPQRVASHYIGTSASTEVDPKQRDNIFHIIELSFSGSAYTLTVDGQSNSTTTTDTFYCTTIGPENNVGWWFGGYLAERIRYSTALSASERARIRAWLANKWGIPYAHFSPYVPQ